MACRQRKVSPFHAPSTLATEHAGEHIGDGVDVGRNVETPPEQVIAGVDDQRDVFGGHDLAQSVDELGAAGAAAEDADHAARLVMRPIMRTS
jgi:hypothetical protein